jgi:hypothetical protein
MPICGFGIRPGLLWSAVSCVTCGSEGRMVAGRGDRPKRVARRNSGEAGYSVEIIGPA